MNKTWLHLGSMVNKTSSFGLKLQESFLSFSVEDQPLSYLQSLYFFE